MMFGLVVMLQFGVPALKIGNRFKSFEETICHDMKLFSHNRIDNEVIRNSFKI